MTVNLDAMPETVEMCARIRNLGRPCGNRIYRPANGVPYCYTCGSSDAGVIYVRVAAILHREGNDVDAYAIESLNIELNEFGHWITSLYDAGDMIKPEFDFWYDAGKTLITLTMKGES